MQQVGVFPFPFSSHQGALLVLIRRLAALAGPEVQFTVFSTARANSPFNNNNDNSNNIKFFDVWDGIPEGYVFKKKIRYYEEIELFMETGPKTLREAVGKSEAETGKKMSCLVGDPFMWFVSYLGDEMGVPWIATFASGMHPLAAHIYTDLIRETIGVQEQAEARKEECLSFIPGNSFCKLRVRDLQAGIVLGDLDSIFARMTYEMGRALPRAAVVATNDFEELDPKLTAHLRSKLKRFLPVGPFGCLQMLPIDHHNDNVNATDDDPNRCIPWLDLHPPNSVLYIAFGSTHVPTGPEIAAIAAALEEKGISFLWSLKQGIPISINPNNGKVVPWCPQMKVLQHPAVAAFLTHYGWNSVMESLSHGVPLIGRPFVGDNYIIARLVEAVWGVGSMVDGGVFTKEGLITAMDKLPLLNNISISIINNNNETSSNNNNNNSTSTIMDNATRFKDQLRKAVGPGGTSTHNLDALVNFIKLSQPQL